MHFPKVSTAVGLLALLPATIASPLGLFHRDSSTGRPKLGNIPYGVDINHCTVPGTIALTYDDGPYIYTSEILDLLKEFDAKATFFVTGNNIGKGAIDSPSQPWAGVIKRMESEGHQIASHTWTHQDLSAISESARKDEMYNNENAIRNIIGKFPTYMRPPYSSCTANSGCVRTMEELGYHIIYFDLDTDDYNNVTPELIPNAKSNFARAVDGTPAAQNDFLAIAHDIHEQTARSLTRFMLETIKKNGYKAVTVGECFGDSKDNWYRS
ncbi:Carbohydrate Esterase Family 4 protein [Tuber magnatum]|uniref:Carbohydrate Esterase Family 4 protein n=1 Tax=Tuber magnatum TaxID=42249 RepID=A0A317SGI7_9PEZI|nr:Carbohydrate Esterase Family 4 protein [Tuber magnatum]